MITEKTRVEEKRECCGCSACASICPKRLIHMEADEEGFLYPYTDSKRCLGCNLCKKVCLYTNEYESSDPKSVLACKCKDGNIRKKSSSGGIFSVLAESIISTGGLVFGAAFDENCELEHSYANGSCYVKFRGSKYVQSNIKNTYVEAKHYLESDKSVLFSGTPCQISGLRHYLNKDYSKLLCVDFICHGTPSPKVLRAHLNEISHDSKSKPVCIRFRTKEGVWKKCTTTTTTTMRDGRIIITKRDPFMLGFLQNLYLRPSCHNCVANNFRSGADITIGDYWGAETKYRSFDDERGVSLVILRSEKGETMLDTVQHELNLIEIDLNHALIFNPNIIRSSKPHRKRDEFFQELNKGEAFSKLIKNYTKIYIEIVRELLTPKQVRMIQFVLAKIKSFF